MALLRRILCECKTLWLQQFARRPGRVQLTTPIVSVTFDDVPCSAFDNGLPILECHGVKATFYVSLGIADGPRELWLAPHHVQELDQRGHEIGCHTFSHYRLTRGSRGGLLADAARNRADIAGLTNGAWPQSFSFPYGEVCFTAKTRLAPHYSSLRSSRPGVNRGWVDFNCMRAKAIGPGSDGPESVERWLDQLERASGWLITYTHGVSDRPGQHDAPPATLDHLLAECRRRAIPVLPVADVMQRFSCP